MAQKKGTTTKKSTAKSGRKAKKPFYKKVWFWLTTVGGTLALVGIGIALFFILRGPSFEKIAEEQTAKIEESGQKVINTFDKDAKNNKKGPEGLNDAYDKAEKSIDKLVDDGLNELDKVKDEKKIDEEDEEEYSKASDKIQDLGNKQKKELTEIYEKDDNYEKVPLDDKQESAENAADAINDELGIKLITDVTVSKTDEKGANQIEITLDSYYLDFFKETFEKALEEGEEIENLESVDDFFKELYQEIIATMKDETSDEIEKPKFVIVNSDGDKLAEG